MEKLLKILKPISYIFIGLGGALLLSSLLIVTNVLPIRNASGDADKEASLVAESEETDTEAPTETYPEGTDLCEIGVHYPKTVPGIPPTCYEAGTSDKTVCEKCGFTLKGAEVLPPMEHKNRTVKEICFNNNMGFTFQAFFNCPDCGLEFYNGLKPEDLGMPIINLTGNFYGLNQHTKIRVSLEYYGEDQTFSCDTTARIQGQSSTLFPKVNYALQFFESGTNFEKKKKVTLFEGHKESKYCLKANYMDASQARNIVAAQLYKEVAETRDNGDPISKLDTQGVIDGYPCLVYKNGVFHGLYTLNMPRDKWVYEMKKSDTLRQAALFSRRFEPSNYLRAHINTENYDWKMEFASTEDIPEIGTAWANQSFNSLIDTLSTYSDAKLKEVLPSVVNIDRTIDCLLYTIFLCCYDNRCKNNLYLTYDGVQWIPTMYDMDASFGLSFDGTFYLPSDFAVGNFTSGGTQLYSKVFTLYRNEINARYRELRSSVLTYENVDAKFRAFFDRIPAICYQSDYALYPSIPKKGEDHYAQIMSFVKARLAYLDAFFGY